ncbi:alpha/beta fold hydrolase [Janthinobacterium sp. B9-8]|uniref:alpha/beta fold hydrolase n=1 Tax=Janthinobacterium sp. B9-8 TaxID=1236179 RepID=UPI000A55D8FC|nr:alpha/beta hydrolase [Janthinobacterium sp. B9-8]
MTLVLLPGMDGTGQLFASFIAALGTGYNVKVVVFPPAEPLGYKELEQIARAALPIDGPYIILGESFSGPIAVSLAASGSPNLKGLILCCSFLSNPRPIFSAFHSLIMILPRVPVSLLARVLFGRFITRELQVALTQALSLVSLSVIRARLQAVLAINVSSQLSVVKVPVLYLRASRDQVVPASASALIAKLNPRTRIIELVAPHCLLQAFPIKAAQEVNTFVRELQSGF